MRGRLFPSAQLDVSMRRIVRAVINRPEKRAMLEFLIVFVAFMIAIVVTQRIRARSRLKADAGLSQPDLARKRALERMADDACDRL